MELQLEPEIPRRVRSKTSNKWVFNRGHKSPTKGKTLEEIYGIERGSEFRRRMCEKQKGHPNYAKKGVNAKPCVAIHDGRLIARFPSQIEAASAIGVAFQTVNDWIRRKYKPKNGWQWFYEAESWKWCDLLTNP